MAEPSTRKVDRDAGAGDSAEASSIDSDFGIGGPSVQDMPGHSTGRRVGRYEGLTFGEIEIQSLIAVGGMGEIYRGREFGQFSARRTVAVKVIRPDRVVSDVELEHFKSEILTLGRLDDLGLARILHTGVAEIDGVAVPYCVMKLIDDGEPLVAYVRRLGLDREAIVTLFRGVVEAVAACHRQNIVHRDLKPANILVDADGRPTVVDFGVACPAGDAAAARAGTPAYMSPEQALGKPVDVRSDVFSLGVVLYESLAGRRPWEFSPDSTAAEIARLVTDAPPPPMGIDDADLERIAATCLAADPASRYASVDELGGALLDWSEARRPRAVRRPSPSRRSPSRRLTCEQLEQKIAFAVAPAPAASPPQLPLPEPAPIVLSPVAAGEPVSAGLLAIVAPGGSVKLTAAGLASKLPGSLPRGGTVRNPRVARGGGEGQIRADGDGGWTLVVGPRQPVANPVLTVHFEVHDVGTITQATAVVFVKPSAPPDPAAFAAYAAG